MTTATQTAPAAGVLNAFELVDADEVRAFLATHPFMEPLLAEVADQLPKYFPGAPLRLQAEAAIGGGKRDRDRAVGGIVVDDAAEL